MRRCIRAITNGIEASHILYTGKVTAYDRNDTLNRNYFYVTGIGRQTSNAIIAKKAFVCIDGPLAGKVFNVKGYSIRDFRLAVNDSARAFPGLQGEEFRPFTYAVLNFYPNLMNDDLFTQLVQMLAEQQVEKSMENIIEAQAEEPIVLENITPAVPVESTPVPAPVSEDHIAPTMRNPVPKPAPQMRMTKDVLREQAVFAKIVQQTDPATGEKKDVFTDVRRVIGFRSSNGKTSDSVLFRELGQEKIKVPAWKQQVGNPNAPDYIYRDKQPVEVGLDLFLSFLNNQRFVLVTDPNILSRFETA